MNTEILERAGMGIVKFQLDMEPEDFHKRRLQFVEDLALALDIDPHQIWIANIRRGCTIAVLLVPLEVRERIISEILSGKVSAELQRIMLNYDIKRTDFEDLIFGLFPESKFPRETERTLTWLHLSDVHLRSKKGARQWLQDQVTEELLNDLPNLLADSNLQPDLVFFTGDLAFSAQKSEYDIAKDFLKKLSDKLPRKPNFFFVPGNHDANWNKIDSKQDHSIRERLSNDTSVAEYLIDETKLENGDWHTRLQRFENFFDFIHDVSDLGQPPINHNFFYTSEIEHQSLRLGIAGLNSAWLSTSKKNTSGRRRDPDLKNLLLGRPQVVSALDDLKGSHIRFALFHHPLASVWFKPFDAQMQKNKMIEFDFILTGHEHRAEAIGIDAGFEKSAHHLAAGALYDHPEYPNSFNVSQINLNTGWFTIFFWCYHHKRNKWDIDTSVQYTRSGRLEFFLKPDLRSRITGTIKPPNNECNSGAIKVRKMPKDA